MVATEPAVAVVTPTKPSPETGDEATRAAQADEWLIRWAGYRPLNNPIARQEFLSLLASARAEGEAAGLKDACDLVAVMVADHPEDEEIIHAAVGRIWFERSIRLRASNPEER